MFLRDTILYQLHLYFKCYMVKKKVLQETIQTFHIEASNAFGGQDLTLEMATATL